MYFSMVNHKREDSNKREELIQNAIAYYKSTPNESQRQVAKRFKIDQTVLCRRLNGKSSSSKSGRKPALSEKIENILAATFVELTELGHGFTRKDMRVLVCDFFKENSNNKYSRLTFGRDWVNAFIKRHPNLTIPAYKRYQKKKKVQEDSQKDTQEDGKFSPAFSTKDFFFRPSIYI